MLTAARPAQDRSAHWYTVEGKPLHEVPKAKGGGVRSTTLADARKMGLLPSVSSVLKDVLTKGEGLINWRIEQAILAVTTAPPLEGESLEDRIKRVLPEMDVERKMAAEKGTAIHDCMEKLLSEKDCEIPANCQVEVTAALNFMVKYMEDNQLHPIACEEVLVGNGYAGTVDLVLHGDKDGDRWVVLDFKTSKSGFKAADHAIQLGAYAAAWHKRVAPAEVGSIRTGNVYISTGEPGLVELVEYDDWFRDYEAFDHLCAVWRYLKRYDPCA